MYQRNLLFVLLLTSAFASSQVINNKKEAVKKGVYEMPAEKTIASVQTTSSIASSKPITTSTVGTKSSTVKSKPVVNSKAFKSKKALINDKPDTDIVIEPAENYVALQMINNAMEFIGVNYRGGGTSKAGMDCSGMVTAVFNIFGMKLPRSSNEMARVGEKLAQTDIKKGDLVFFRTNGKDTINHVGMVIETDGDEIKFIHSSTQKGVIISSTKEPYYKKTFAQANRVIM